MMVDPLQNVTHGHATLRKMNFVGVVNVSRPAGNRSQEFPGHGKIHRHGADVVFSA